MKNITYVSFLKKIKKKYKFIFFDELNLKKNKQLILRHDIDFDLYYALKIAKIERKLNIKSTFFFLIRSDSYNLFSPESLKIIKEIKKLKHQISLHFDPSVYQDNNVEVGLKYEKELFEILTNQKLKIISFHRPMRKYINLNKKISGLDNTYMNKYMKKIFYFSDSANNFRFGDPTKTNAFKNKLNIQLLLHPIWWQNQFKTDSNRVIKNLFIEKNKQFNLHLSKNCKFYIANFDHGVGILKIESGFDLENVENIENMNFSDFENNFYDKLPLKTYVEILKEIDQFF